MSLSPTPPVAFLDRLADTAEGVRRELAGAAGMSLGRILFLAFFAFCLLRIASLYVRFKAGALPAPRRARAPRAPSAPPSREPLARPSPVRLRPVRQSAESARPLPSPPPSAHAHTAAARSAGSSSPYGPTAVRRAVVKFDVYVPITRWNGIAAQLPLHTVFVATSQ
ncbi:MAG TPA: hypothetical protein VHS58_14750 [Acetobacteraceae bacterium]|nr:hypothetical protein [Acetobacteraceae bacterium]